MTAPCGCCAGTEPLTPAATANRPGLPVLSYRVGTHATFLETMKARLSNLFLEVPEQTLDELGRLKISRIYPLRNLKTRSTDDPAIALLDAWATVGDVLTFYQERIANEGYLRTATERRSILELARLIGYALRPGVASTVYLAYTLDEDRSVTPPKPTAVTIPAGARAQSVPGPGELPQSFETADALEARSSWNNLQVRLNQPQTKESILEGLDQEPPTPRVYLKGIATGLGTNDPLLIDFDGNGQPLLYRVLAVKPDPAADRTLVALQAWTAKERTVELAERVAEILSRYRGTVKTLRLGNLKLVQRINTALAAFEDHLAADQTGERLPEQIQDIQKSLTNELPNAAAHARRGDLTPLLTGLIGDLDAAVTISSEPARSTALTADSSQNLIPAAQLLGPLLKPASIPPASAARLTRNVASSFADRADAGLQLLSTFQPVLSAILPAALAGAKATPDNHVRVYALRVKASLFGNNAPLKPKILNRDTLVMTTEEWGAGDIQATEEPTAVALDASYDKILRGGWIVVDTGAVTKSEFVTPAEPPILIAKARTVSASMSRAAYGLSGKSTRIELADPSHIAKLKAWVIFSQPGVLLAKDPPDDAFQIIRRTAVYAQSEELPLADEPIGDDVCGGNDDPIELDGLYDGLKSGRWLIMSGERADIKVDGAVVPGVKSSELVMLAAVTQDVTKIDGGKGVLTGLPGDKTHTFIQLATGLAYCYKRDTVTIYGNVVKATHGETRNEVLGSGDGSKALQQFTLRQPPLTFVPAANPAGADSTLQVRVNDVLWHETDSLAGLLPTDREFITKTDFDAKTTVIFGNGQRGARLPTGQENVKAVYRNGIGKPGNVKADQISLLATRPLGVKAVTNPLRASGGADKDSRDQARQNAPLAVMALDRLVSTQDYADFARTFAGIGKASAARLSDGRRPLVHVTIAGADDIPIDMASDLYRNLIKALRDFGDPYLPIQVKVRELLALVISARVRILPDYQLETLEPKIRSALLDGFSFERRDLGEDAVLSQAISIMQRVEGVAYVDVDVFAGIPSVDPKTGDPLTPDQITASVKDLAADPKSPYPRVPVMPAERLEGRIQPAQLAYLTPDVPATLILNEATA